MTATNTRNCWLLFALAAASFVFTLSNVQYTGEEAVYPLMSYEMWYHGHLLTPVMYGQDYWRPPLDNWLITMVSMLIGWSHMLVAARLIAALATVGSGLLVGWFAGRVWKERRLAAFAALVYITLGDVLFYDGWLAYSDPLFAFFCLAAMLLGWLAVMERRVGFFAVAVLALSCAFLTKALTVYVFYGVAVLVVTYQTRGWRFLFSWPSWGIHLLALVIPVLWYAMASAGGTMAHGMFDDIISKLQADVPYQVFEHLPWNVRRHHQQIAGAGTAGLPTSVFCLPCADFRAVASGRRRRVVCHVAPLSDFPYERSAGADGSMDSRSELPALLAIAAKWDPLPDAALWNCGTGVGGVDR